MIENALETIRDTIYNVEDRNIMTSAREHITEALKLLRGATKKENGLTLRHPVINKSPSKNHKSTQPTHKSIQQTHKIKSLRPLPNNNKLTKAKTRKAAARKLVKKALRLKKVNRNAQHIVIPSIPEQSPSPCMPKLPEWGGTHRSNFGTVQHVSQTCPVDNYLALLAVDNELQESITSHPNTPTIIQQITQSINKNNFTQAKILLAVHLNLPNHNRTFNFYGNEHEMFLHLLSPIFSITTTSFCNSLSCPQKFTLQTHKDIQGLPDDINIWLDNNLTMCHRALGTVHEGQQVVFLESNIEDGGV